MGRLRMSLAGTVIFALLGGLAGGALAQDPDAATWTHVTGSTNMDPLVLTEPLAGQRWDGSVQYMDGPGYVFTVEWSDPRLPETMRMRRQATLHHGDMQSPDDWMLVVNDALRLDGADGAWAGFSQGVHGPFGALALYELTGEGAYEGLSAVLAQDNSEFPVVRFDGWIFEGDLPPMPEPVEPMAEQPARDSSADSASYGPSREGRASVRIDPLFVTAES